MILFNFYFKMITKEAAYKKITELVERFEEQFASYKKSDYNETLTRRDFIDPFSKHWVGILTMKKVTHNRTAK